MTIKKRLAQSNIAMLVIPLLTAAVLLLLGLGAALLLLRENMTTLHDAMEQMEGVLHGFKLTLSLFAAAASAVLLASVVLTDLYLTRSLFRHISRPLDILTAAWLYRSAVNAGMNKSLWMILGLAGNVLAVAAFLIVRDAP